MRKTHLITFNHPHGWLKLTRVDHDSRIAYELLLDVDGDSRQFLLTDCGELTALGRAAVETDRLLKSHNLPPVNWDKEGF